MANGRYFEQSKIHCSGRPMPGRIRGRYRPILKATEQGTAPVGCGCQLGCTIWGCIYWRNLQNTTEPSVCDSDAALCQITL